jgi:hypothetical protein
LDGAAAAPAGFERRAGDERTPRALAYSVGGLLADLPDIVRSDVIVWSDVIVRSDAIVRNDVITS